ncbi:MAG TPA: hypothetical protein VHG53_07905 [Candidatus Limnocylindria bacterium]|nr:hypothetical protein [Candidatus Limnocylindria bacterium]
MSEGEFPDDETGRALAFKLGAAGNVCSTTLRAFASAEMSKIIAKPISPGGLPAGLPAVQPDAA